MAETPITVTRHADAIAILTLNRPTRLNALTRDMVADINGALDVLAADKSCRAIILTGAGRGFCSGQDLDAANARNAAGGGGVVEKLHWQEQFAGMGRRLRAMPQVAIAAVNGPAVGAGMAMALACDVRLIAPSAKFLVAAVRIGLSGGESGLSYLLPRLIGAARAFDILLTGRTILADEAERIGLCLRVVDSEVLLQAAIEYAEQVLSNSPYSVQHTKRLMWDNLDAPSYAAALEVENRAQILAAMTQDYKEATAAFMEKRPPRFTGA